MNSATVRVRATSSTHPATASTVPHRVVMWEKPEAPEGRNFVTHVEVFQPDRPAHFVWGHYDLSYDEALRDFKQRCKGNGVTPGKIRGKK